MNTNQELTTKIKQTYDNIKIWNQVEENLTKSREIFLSYAKGKVRMKLTETLDLRQRDLNITNDPLLPILTSLETETITTNDAAEEPIEADFLEELQITQEGHDAFQTCKDK